MENRVVGADAESTRWHYWEDPYLKRWRFLFGEGGGDFGVLALLGGWKASTHACALLFFVALAHVFLG